MSFWSKADSGWSPSLDVTISTSGGAGHVIYDNSSGASSYSAGSRTATIHLNGGLGNTYWLRFERNIEADFESVSGATTWTNTDSVTYYPGGSSKNWYVDQIRLSNSYSSEQNILGPGVIGHILANRTWASPGASPTRTWFHYDQVGSVMATSDYNGSLIARKYQDAFGNRQTGWNGSTFSGLWSPAGGWQHNTKEVDGFTNLTYMYQRWYNSADGRFMSRARYHRRLEHPYSFARQNPPTSFDATGQMTLEECLKACMAESTPTVCVEEDGTETISKESGKMARFFADCQSSCYKTFGDGQDDSFLSKVEEIVAEEIADAVTDELMGVFEETGHVLTDFAFRAALSTGLEATEVLILLAPS